MSEKITTFDVVVVGCGIAGLSAAATALQAQFPAIKRVVAKFSGLPAGPIIVVLTSDYS